MSLSKLVTTFEEQAAKNSGNITINAASFTESDLIPPSNLDDLLAKGFKLAKDSFLLVDTTIGGIPDPVDNVLTITKGTVNVLNVPEKNTDVTLIITADAEGNVEFTIQVDLSDWTFETSWEFMTGGVFDNLPYTKPSFVFSTEALDSFSWQNQNIKLVEGQNFAALITLTKWLQPVTDFFTSWNSNEQLALIGSLDPSNVNNETIIYPEMNLSVSINATLVSLGFLNVSNPAVGFLIETIEEKVTEEDSDVEDNENGLVVSTDDEPETEQTQTPSLYFQLELDLGTEIRMDFTASVQPDSSNFDISVTSDPDKPLTPLNIFSLMADNNWFSNIPPTLQQFLNFIVFKEFNTSLNFTEDKSVNISSVSALVGSNPGQTWQLFNGFTITSFDVNWVILQPGPGRLNSQSLFFTASADFFPDLFKGGFDVEVTSDLTLSAAFTGTVSINDVLTAITGGFVKIPESLVSVNLTGFGVNMDIPGKYYAFDATGDIAFDIITNVSLTDAALQLTSTSAISENNTQNLTTNVYTASISGLFAIGILQLQSAVSYNSSKDGGWDLSIAMLPGEKLDLGELMDGLFKMVGFQLPTSFLPADLAITGFELIADVPNGDEKGSYEVKTSIGWNFTFPIINQDIDITADLALKYNAAAATDKQYSGGVKGSILLEYFNAQVDIGYNFEGKDQLLMIEWEGFIAKYNVSGESETIIFEIKNWSVGSLITAFMRMLFKPDFELGAPWDVLNKISLDGFKVTYNLKTKEVVVDYKLPKSLNLIFITIDGLRLTKNSEGVQISFDGNSPVPAIKDSKLLGGGEGQDIEKMPEVPGQGSQYFELRLLALGQHIALKDIDKYQSIKEVTDQMIKAFQEPKEGVNPIEGSDLLSFDENSNWLVASDFGILNVGTKEKPIWTLEMQVVFNDPNLYGLRIAMAGSKAKVLAGLDFEIMYKKISDAVGVYQMELTLPDALRYLQFGAVNITLPSIGVEIYTNGDFKVDIGFPYNMDFSRSFSVQAIVPPGIPAMGSGGFYIGKLSGVTSTQVPKTSYGDFNPVIVFGIGMQVGVGYSINYGVLKAGFSITVFGILEGVIATYHPYQGKLQESNSTEVETSYYYWLQGTFGIIGILYGSLDFGIISATVNITVKVYAQATLEAYNKMPLAIVASVDVKVSAKLNLGLFSIKINFSFKAKIQTDLTIGTDNTANAPWNKDLLNTEVARVAATAARFIAPQKVMHYNSNLIAATDEEKPVLNIYLIPHLTVAGPENGNLKDQSAQYVTSLWIDAPNPEQSDEPVTSFQYLSQDFFRWLIQNYSDETGTDVTRAEADNSAVSQENLDELYAFLSNVDNPLPIDPNKLVNFLKTTFKAVNIQNLKSEDQIGTAAVFPMLFDLGLSVPDANVDLEFSTYNMATDAYLSEVKQWFAELEVKVAEENNNDGMARKMAEPIEHSLSTFVFEDYFILIGKQLIGYAGDALKNYTYPLTNGSSLLQMVNWADAISTEKITNAISASSIAKSNDTHPLNGNLPLEITGVLYEVLDGDTFKSISAIYALYTDLLIIQNDAVPGIVAVQSLTFNEKTYEVKITDTITDIATELDTTVADLAASKKFQRETILTIDASLVIAAANYVAQNEDTFTSVSATTYNGISVEDLFIQNQIVPGLFISGDSFKYKDTTYTIEPGDTVTSIAASLSVTVSDLASDSAFQALQVQPLGTLLIQPFIHTTAAFTEVADAETLASIAKKYNTTPTILGTNYANQNITNLYYAVGDYASVNIPDLKCLDVQSILNYFDTSQSYTQLSGMASRYQLHGMRLPTNLPGLTLDPNSPCIGDNCALYRLTGQQFELPETVTTDFVINLENSTLDWLEFDGVKPEKDDDGNMIPATLPLQLTTEDVTQITTVLDYAQDSGIVPDILSLKPITPYELAPMQYAFKTVTKWNSSGETTLPYGSLGNQTTISSLIWEFPSSLLQQVALPRAAGSAFDIEIGTYNSKQGIMDYKKSSYYGWATMLSIDIKKQAEDKAPGTDAFTYELIGADEAGTQILERLLKQLDPNSANNNQGIIEDIQWMYEGEDGVVSVGNINMKTFIVQSNLSTETNPQQGSAAFLARTADPIKPNGVLNTLYDFVKLLWECSITRSGGYYLLYDEIASASGFPDSIFDTSGNATISLYVNYSSSFNNILKEYMNCAVTGDQIDTNGSIVYAESKVQDNISYTAQNDNETLATIADRYNILISELATLNETSVALNTAAKPIVLTNLVYEVGLPGSTPTNTLTAIATYYNVTEDAIKNSNKEITSWDNLPLWQLINIPEVTYATSTATGTPGNTFKSIADYYFIDVDTLAVIIMNDAVFTNGTQFKIRDQIVNKIATVNQGDAGFELQRTNPDTTAESSESYLNNLYNLLNYQVVKNNYFYESVVGLPAGPVNSQSQDEILDKEETTEDGIWKYNQVIPVAKFAVENPKMEYPTNYPQAEDNPYRGIGNTVQVHFDWVDYYGNQTVTPFTNPSLDSNSPLNNPPIQVGYMDELKGFSQWPSVFLTYNFGLNKNDIPELSIDFSFNTTRYENTDNSACITDIKDTANMGEWQRNAIHDLTIYTTIYYQINQLNPETGENTLNMILSSSLIPGVKNTLEFDALNAFVKEIYTYLYAIANCAKSLPPVPTMQSLTQTIETNDLTTESILELTVNLDLYRDLSFVNNDFKDSPSVTKALTIVQPNTQVKTGDIKNDAGDVVQEHTLTAFAINFEETFYSANEYILKVATGVNEAVAGSKKNQVVYVVRMGLKSGNGIYWDVAPTNSYELTESSITSLTSSGVPKIVTDKLVTLIGTVYSSQEAFNTALKGTLTEEEFTTYQIKIYTYSLLNASFYAPTPIATSLESKKDVPLCTYVTGAPLNCDNGSVKSFTGIDLDLWGKQCLEAIDIFLGSNFSVPAFLVDQLKTTEEQAFLAEQNIDAKSFLEAITKSKSKLAEVISKTIAPVLTAPQINGDQLLSAQEKFKQQLLMELGNAYSINAVVQMEVTAESGITKDNDEQIAPRLYGTPTIINESEEDSKLYAISNAKIQLNFDDENASSDLSFIFSTKDAKEFSTVSLNMDYQITHIEYDIENVPNVEGYQASQWLTFIIPANIASLNERGIDESPLIQSLGNVEIPVVLRNYPTPPTLTKQEGVAVSTVGDTTKVQLEKASEWNYNYTYSEDQAAQDQMYSDIEFNTIKADDLAQSRLAVSNRNLFNDMAQMISVWPQVLNDLNKYLVEISPDSSSDDPNLNNAYFAMQTLVQIINNFAIAREEYKANANFLRTSTSPTTRAYDFIIQQKEDSHFTTTCPCENDEECKRLVVNIVPPEGLTELDRELFMNNDIVQEAALPHVPVVYIENYFRKDATDENGVVIKNSYWYATENEKGEITGYLGYPCSFEIPNRTVNVKGLNVLQFQHAWAGIAVIRNENLVEDNPTNKAFIYRTPLVKFSNKLIPLLSYGKRIDISTIENQAGIKAPLNEHLATFFKTFFTADELKEQTIKISASWNYNLKEGSALPPVLLPVLLYTPFAMQIPSDYTIPDGGCPDSITSDTPFICQMASAIERWYAQMKPVTTEAYLKFDLSVFSALSETQLPLIQLSDLVLPYVNIENL
jgi:hypothetical protein